MNEPEKLLDKILEENHYVSKEPFRPGAKVVYFENGALIPAIFRGYTTCYTGAGRKTKPCSTCPGSLELTFHTKRKNRTFYSACSTAAWPHAHRRVFLVKDPIVTAIKVAFYY
jgi:hypothetical protein